MNKWFFALICLFILAAIAGNFYTFYVQKNYAFTVEAPCDPLAQSCFERDCEEDGCPPNGLATYRVFDINAADFSSCTDNSCLSECLSGTIQCQEVLCGESPDDTCSGSSL